nr:ORF2 [Epsilontorquevirus sp.]
MLGGKIRPFLPVVSWAGPASIRRYAERVGAIRARAPAGLGKVLRVFALKLSNRVPIYCCYLLPQQTGEVYVLRVPAMQNTRKEETWLSTCKMTHSLFCNCGDWWHHLVRIKQDYEGQIQLWLTGGGDAATADPEGAGGEPDTAGGGTGGGDAHGSAMDDAAFAAAANAAEEEDTR